MLSPRAVWETQEFEDLLVKLDPPARLAWLEPLACPAVMELTDERVTLATQDPVELTEIGVEMGSPELRGPLDNLDTPQQGPTPDLP